MFGFNKRDAASKEKPSMFQRLKQGLAKTRAKFSGSLADIILGKKSIDQDLLEEIENQLLLADIGFATTTKIIEDLTAKVARKELANPSILYDALKTELINILTPVAQPLDLTPGVKPFVILMVGINGAGKTTTIGKLAKSLQQQGKQVMLAAGDTFRAAAIEQLQAWGEHNNIPVVAQHSGADSASVIFDAVTSAKSRLCDVLIADTAGRLHTQSNLMDELKKVVRVIKKVEAGAPHETLLVLDASIGQNALTQAKEFFDAVGVTGLAITKLDGTAKGGIVFTIASQLGLPIRFIGIGEGIDDLRPFNAQDFVNALFE